MDNLKKKTSKAFFWDMAGRFSIQGVGFVVSIFLARLLDPSDFGLLAMVNVIISLSSIFIDTGLGKGLIQKKEVGEVHYGTVFFFNISVGILLTLVVFLLSDTIAAFYRNEQIANIMKVMSFSFLFSSMGAVIRTKLRKELNFNLIVQSSFFGAVFSGVIGVFMAFQGFGVWSLVTQSLTGIVLSNVYLFIREKWRPKFVFKPYALKELWGFGVRIFFVDILDILLNNFDKMMIGKFFSPQKLGFYYRAQSFQALIHSYTGASLSAVFFPAFSQIQNDQARLVSIVFRTFRILVFLSFYLVGLLYLVAEDIFVILFSEKWLPAVPYFRILVLSGFVNAITPPLVNIILARGYSSNYMKIGIMRNALHLIPLVMLPFFRIEVFLYGLVCYSLACLSIFVWYASKAMGEKKIIFFRIIFSSLLLTLSLVVLLYSLGGLLLNNYFSHLFVIATVYTLLYWSISTLFNMEALSLLKEQILLFVAERNRRK